MAVRAALGAGRGRLVGQLLTETLVLSLAGALAGMSLASLLLLAAKVVLAQMLPYTAAAGIDTRAAGFCAGLTLVVTLLAGVAPALRSARGNSGNPLNEAARGSSGEHAGIRRVMVTGEFALSLVLVCGALLLFRTLLNLQRLDTGVRIDNIVTMSVNLPEQTYPGPRRAALYYSAAAERLSAAPGVAGVGLSSVLPLQWIGNGEGLQVAGMEPINVRLKRVDPGYFRTFEIPILSGRGITTADREGSPGVVVLNETLAARLADLAGIQQPIGRKVRVSVPHFADKGMTWTEMEIVGVIRSERVAGPGRPDPPVAYVPLAQIPHREVKLSVRSQSEPASVMPAVREALHAVDPNLPLGDVATMQQVRNRTLSGASRPAWLIGVFAGIAVLLAAIGLSGVLSYAVTQQRREIGIRMALGALSRDVVAEVLRNAFTMILAGLALGMLGAFAVTRVLENLLFEVSPLDPLALGAACVAMMVTGLIASFVPANRAARVDPVTTLRDE
jgi:putative ABC transport system permease protein